LYVDGGRVAIPQKNPRKAGFLEGIVAACRRIASKLAPALFNLGFFIDYVLANRRIVFLRFQLLRVQTFVLGNRVVMAGTGSRYEFDFVAHIKSSA
jgi:hypothetical protein